MMFFLLFNWICLVFFSWSVLDGEILLLFDTKWRNSLANELNYWLKGCIADMVKSVKFWDWYGLVWSSRLNIIKTSQWTMGIERPPYFSAAKEWCSYNLEMIFALDHYRIWYRWFGGITSTNFWTVNKRRGHTWPQWSTLDSPSSPAIGRPQKLIRRRSGGKFLSGWLMDLICFLAKNRHLLGL